ncbi:HNH endonuclease [Pseudomonas viridiflava]|nr:HNH endonuclease [Pseudomonas viridiflava]
MRYWWVNHKQTSRYEINGEFLWSPMLKSDGRRNYFYDTMKEASPGDLVVSYSNAKVSFVGQVLDFAVAAPKPPAFGETGMNWNKNNGWLLPVAWTRLKKQVSPKAKLDKLADVLPVKYSPISSVTGKGNQGAYLAEIGAEVFHNLDLDFDYDLTALKRNVTANILLDIDKSIENKILDDRSIDETVRKSLVNARVGQGVFKENIYEFENFCRLTKITNPRFLIASHIKPWRLCETAHERLDGANGLLLTPNADFLFDRGLITFCDSGKPIYSSQLDDEIVRALVLESNRKNSLQEFHSHQQAYLKYHRDKIFLN